MMQPTKMPQKEQINPAPVPRPLPKKALILTYPSTVPRPLPKKALILTFASQERSERTSDLSRSVPAYLRGKLLEGDG